MRLSSLFFGLVPLAIVSLTCTCASEARAEPADAPSPPPTEPAASARGDDAPHAPHSPQWYGWQTLVVDAAALGITLAGASSGSAGAVAGISIYAIAPPIVHIAHDRVGIGIADLGVRVFAPLGMGLLGYELDIASSKPCPPDGDLCFRGVGGAALGVVAGYVVAVAVDAAVFSFDDGSAPHAPPGGGAQRYHSRTFTWSPTAAVTPTGVSAGVAGTF